MKKMKKKMKKKKRKKKRKKKTKKKTKKKKRKKKTKKKTKKKKRKKKTKKKTKKKKRKCSNWVEDSTNKATVNPAICRGPWKGAVELQIFKQSTTGHSLVENEAKQQNVEKEKRRRLNLIPEFDLAIA